MLDIAGLRHGETHQDYAALCRQSRRLDKFAEILVEREEHASSRASRASTSRSVLPGAVVLNANDIMPCRIKSGDCCAMKILISEERHIKPLSDIPFLC